jgi:hypothetical protein
MGFYMKLDSNRPKGLERLSGFFYVVSPVGIVHVDGDGGY